MLHEKVPGPPVVLIVIVWLLQITVDVGIIVNEGRACITTATVVWFTFPVPIRPWDIVWLYVKDAAAQAVYLYDVRVNYDISAKLDNNTVIQD